MIIQKIDDCYQIKIFKEVLGDFDVFDRKEIEKLFQKILIKLLKKYEIKGLLDVDVYVQPLYGMIIEMKEVYSYFDEIDMRIHFHLEAIFLNEVSDSEVLKSSEIYYYKGKFYKVYDGIGDSCLIYKEDECEEIIEKGVKL